MASNGKVTVEISLSAAGLDLIVSQAELCLGLLDVVRAAKWGDHAVAIQHLDVELRNLRDWLSAEKPSPPLKKGGK